MFNKRISYHENTVKIARELIKRKSTGSFPLRVLELGPGDFWFQKHFSSEELSQLDYYYIDVTPPQNDVYGSFIQLDIDNAIHGRITMPSYLKDIDIVICNEVIEHFDWPIGFASMLWSTMKPEGTIILSTPNVYNVQNLISNIIGIDTVGRVKNTIVSKSNFYKRSHVVHFSAKSLKDVFSNFFEDVSAKVCGNASATHVIGSAILHLILPKHRPSIFMVATKAKPLAVGATTVNCKKNGFFVPCLNTKCLHAEPQKTVCKRCEFFPTQWFELN